MCDLWLVTICAGAAKQQHFYSWQAAVFMWSTLFVPTWNRALNQPSIITEGKISRKAWARCDVLFGSKPVTICDSLWKLLCLNGILKTRRPAFSLQNQVKLSSISISRPVNLHHWGLSEEFDTSSAASRKFHQNVFRVIVEIRDNISQGALMKVVSPLWRETPGMPVSNTTPPQHSL